MHFSISHHFHHIPNETVDSPLNSSWWSVEMARENCCFGTMAAKTLVTLPLELKGICIVHFKYLKPSFDLSKSCCKYHELELCQKSKLCCRNLTSSCRYQERHFDSTCLKFKISTLSKCYYRCLESKLMLQVSTV